MFKMTDHICTCEKFEYEHAGNRPIKWKRYFIKEKCNIIYISCFDSTIHLSRTFLSTLLCRWKQNRHGVEKNLCFFIKFFFIVLYRQAALALLGCLSQPTIRKCKILIRFLYWFTTVSRSFLKLLKHYSLMYSYNVHYTATSLKKK